MPNITRTKSRQSLPATKTKIVLVRQPVKSVRRTDEIDRTPLRLAIGVIVALGVVGVVWLLGYLGYRLGFAPLVRVPDLAIDGSGGGLVTGAMMLIALPKVILYAGMAEPMWLMLGFVLIAIPAASLGAVKPRALGGPRPKQAAVVLSSLGAAAAMLNGAAMIAWTVSPWRARYLGELPFNPALAEAWQENLRIASGLDVLATVAAALWVVVTMRLTIPLWLRALAASASLFALVVVAVAMSMSNAAAAQIDAHRSVFFLDDGSLQPQLVIGYTPQSLAALGISGQQPAMCIVELRDRPEVLIVIGRQSIVEYMISRAARDESAP